MLLLHPADANQRERDLEGLQRDAPLTLAVRRTEEEDKIKLLGITAWGGRMLPCKSEAARRVSHGCATKESAYLSKALSIQLTMIST
jgi:hypothetical protein